MPKETITIRYEIKNTEDYRPYVAIEETLVVDIDEQGIWVITNPTENIPQWTGRHWMKQQAILNYLSNRLGMYEIKKRE